MLSVVIALLTVAAMAGSVLTLRQMRRNREVNELLLRLRMRDALLTVVWLATRELSRRRTDAHTAARLVVDLLIAAGTRGAASAVTPRGTRGMGPHVLIADDDRPSLNGLEALLTRWGCRVETATDGQMALAKTLALHPSLVITFSRCPV